MFELKKYMMTTAIAALMAVGGGLANDAQASTVTVSKTFDLGGSDGNDCAGYFGDSFDACEIFINDSDEKIKLSPVIAKYGFNDDGSLAASTSDDPNPEINTALYSSVDGSEFTWTGSDTTSGTWSYAQGTDDPGVKYWVAKGGNLFNLFWTVETAATEDGGACTGTDLYTLDCLSEALVVNTGDWFTPEQKGLSHLTFYDSVPVSEVPVPAAGLLLLTAVGGLGLAARRRRGKIK